MNNDIKLVILVSSYPSEAKPNELGFVHSRVRAYLKCGMTIDVYRLSETIYSYEFDGVRVFCGPKEYLKERLDNTVYDMVLIHFLDEKKAYIVGDRKCIIWVHGFEALSWKRRLYNLNLRLPIYIYENTKQLKFFKKYALTHPDSYYVFVSQWMKDITCKDIGYNISNCEIIHNYIDNSIFSYREKEEDQRKNLLLIRSFANKKYANDITVRFIKKISTKPYFSELKIQIYGDGKFFNKLTRKLSIYNNITVHKGFITQQEIAALQKEFGVFLCPTRQDAQGVSMCEAMSSGLVPLTSNNTAIPLFVDNNVEGFLCDNNRIESFVEAYEKIYNSPDRFKDMSAAASIRVRTQCSYDNTVQKEIEVIKSILLS